MIIVISLSDLTSRVIVSHIPVRESECMIWFHLKERLDLVFRHDAHTHTLSHSGGIKRWNTVWQAERHAHTLRLDSNTGFKQARHARKMKKWE